MCVYFVHVGDNHGATKQACIQIQSGKNQKARITVVRQAMQVWCGGMGKWALGKISAPASQNLLLFQKAGTKRQVMKVGSDGMGRWVAGKMSTPAGQNFTLILAFWNNQKGRTKRQAMQVVCYRVFVFSCPADSSIGT